MAVNKNALIRYKTIDHCLQNRFRKWTLNDLIDACSDALYEYEGKDTYVSKRTVQLDIQMMRSDKLGYNAPIVVYDRKYYTYEEEDYSITNSPLSDQDLNKLSETVAFLKQFQGFSHFEELSGMIQKLEAHVYAKKTQQKAAIDFEKNENLKGLEFLDVLYRAIIHKKALKITYKSFKARQEGSFHFYPYLLKEYRNRWFLIGCQKKDQPIMNIALDRIIKVEPTTIEFHEKKEFNPETYFDHVIGVSVSPTMANDEVKLFVTHKHAPYVLTKPLHPSQELIEKDNYGIIISLSVQHNFELEKAILGFGDGVKVLAPRRLRQNIKDRLIGAIDLYETEITTSGLQAAIKKLEYRGSANLNKVYTKREVRKVKSIIDAHIKNDTSNYAIRNVLQEIPQLKHHLFNKNIKRIVEMIDKKAVLTKAIYFDKPAQANWYVTWHQDKTINVSEKLDVEGYSAWTKKESYFGVCPPTAILENSFTIRVHLDDTDEKNGALKVVQGSHKKKLSDDEIQLISNNSVAQICDAAGGGIHLMKPLLLHASGKSKSQKRRRVIHLEFSSAKLPEGLEWAEKLNILT